MPTKRLFPDAPQWPLLVAWLLASWTPSAMAMEAVAGISNLGGLPWGQILMSAAICLWGSMGRTSQRETLAKEDGMPFIFWKELFRDARITLVVGPMVFLGANARGGVGDFEMAFILLAAGYLGPTALDLMVSKIKGRL